MRRWVVRGRKDAEKSRGKEKGDEDIRDATGGSVEVFLRQIGDSKSSSGGR